VPHPGQGAPSNAARASKITSPLSWWIRSTTTVVKCGNSTRKPSEVHNDQRVPLPAGTRPNGHTSQDLRQNLLGWQRVGQRCAIEVGPPGAGAGFCQSFWPGGVRVEFIRSVRRHTSSTRHRPPNRHRDQKRAKSGGKTEKRAAQTGRGPSYVSQDTLIMPTPFVPTELTCPVSEIMSIDHAVSWAVTSRWRRTRRPWLGLSRRHAASPLDVPRIMSSVGAVDLRLDRCNETVTAGFSPKVALSKPGSAPAFGGRANHH
jgi:hypothetical protein